MRYIRTKDTIFEVVEETDAVYRVKAKGNPHNIYSKSKCQTEVIKFADTVEELCDEFIGISNLTNTGYVITARLAIKKLNERITFSGGIYGAIWTDKGLIYVAKMNDKGELELL
jgi:hypothetical protein